LRRSGGALANWRLQDGGRPIDLAVSGPLIVHDYSSMLDAAVTVPAGRFTALRFFNIINFRYRNVAERTAAQRLETVWFAPEIGRWVARESRGSFRESLGTPVYENTYRWELLECT
jgi:hypothetical protein